MIEIRGEAEVLDTGGQQIMPDFDPEMFRIRPRRIVSFGLHEGEDFGLNARSVSSSSAWRNGTDAGD